MRSLFVIRVLGVSIVATALVMIATMLYWMTLQEQLCISSKPTLSQAAQASSATDSENSENTAKRHVYLSMGGLIPDFQKLYPEAQRYFIVRFENQAAVFEKPDIIVVNPVHVLESRDIFTIENTGSKETSNSTGIGTGISVVSNSANNKLSSDYLQFESWVQSHLRPDDDVILHLGDAHVLTPKANDVSASTSHGNTMTNKIQLPKSSKERAKTAQKEIWTVPAAIQSQEGSVDKYIYLFLRYLLKSELLKARYIDKIYVRESLVLTKPKKKKRKKNVGNNVANIESSGAGALDEYEKGDIIAEIQKLIPLLHWKTDYRRNGPGDMMELLSTGGTTVKSMFGSSGERIFGKYKVLQQCHVTSYDDDRYTFVRSPIVRDGDKAIEGGRKDGMMVANEENYSAIAGKNADDGSTKLSNARQERAIHNAHEGRSDHDAEDEAPALTNVDNSQDDDANTGFDPTHRHLDNRFISLDDPLDDSHTPRQLSIDEAHYSVSLAAAEHSQQKKGGSISFRVGMDPHIISRLITVFERVFQGTGNANKGFKVTLFVYISFLDRYPQLKRHLLDKGFNLETRGYEPDPYLHLRSHHHQFLYLVATWRGCQRHGIGKFLLVDSNHERAFQIQKSSVRPLVDPSTRKAGKNLLYGGGISLSQQGIDIDWELNGVNDAFVTSADIIMNRPTQQTSTSYTIDYNSLLLDDSFGWQILLPTNIIDLCSVLSVYNAYVYPEKRNKATVISNQNHGRDLLEESYRREHYFREQNGRMLAAEEQQLHPKIYWRSKIGDRVKILDEVLQRIKLSDSTLVIDTDFPDALYVVLLLSKFLSATDNQLSKFTLVGLDECVRNREKDRLGQSMEIFSVAFFVLLILLLVSFVFIIKANRNPVTIGSGPTWQQFEKMFQHSITVGRKYSNSDDGFDGEEFRKPSFINSITAKTLRVNPNNDHSRDFRSVPTQGEFTCCTLDDREGIELVPQNHRVKRGIGSHSNRDDGVMY